MTEANRYPSPRDLASPDKVQKAEARGLSLGFSGQFLDHFVETELRMMQKWDAKNKSLVTDITA